MCSFHDPIDGVQFVHALQHELLKLPWPERLLEQAPAASVMNPDGGVLLFAGLRLRAVLHTGWPTTIEVQRSYHMHATYIKFLHHVGLLSQAPVHFADYNAVILVGLLCVGVWNKRLAPQADWPLSLPSQLDQ